MEMIRYSTAYPAPQCHEPDGAPYRQRSIHPAVVQDLDRAFPELYCAAETAIAYFGDEGGSEPPLIASALKSTRDRLHRILAESGLLDEAGKLPLCSDPDV